MARRMTGAPDGARERWRRGAAARGRVAIACTLLLTGLVSSGIQPPAAGAANPPGFGNEINLSDMAGRSVRSAVATAGSNVYVVWQDAIARPDGTRNFSHILFRRSTDQGVTFEPLQELDLGTGASVFPWVAAVDSYVYVVWSNSPIQGEFIKGEWDLYFSYSDNGGASFSPPVNLSNTKGVAGDGLVVASGANVYVAWVDRLRDPSCAQTATPCIDLMLRASDDYGSIFGSTVKLNVDKVANEYGAYDFAASGNDAYAVWKEWDPAGGADIYLTHIAGTTVGDPVAVNDPPGKLSTTPAVAADGDRVYVAWAEDDPADIVLRVGTGYGQTLEPARNLSQNPGGSIYPKLRASAGKVYAAWLDGSDGRTDIFFTRSADAGATFPEPVNLSGAFNSLYGSWAWFFSMGASGDQVYMAWPIRSKILVMGSQDGGLNLLTGGGHLLPIFLASAEGTGSAFRPMVRPGLSGVYATWDEGDWEDGNGEIWEIPTFGGANRDVMFRAQPGLEPDLILDRVGAVQTIYAPPKLVAGKKTLVQAVITNGFNYEVQTTVKLTYDPGTGTQTTLIQPVTLLPGTNSVYLPDNDFLLPTGTTFWASVVVDPDNLVTETKEDNNTQEFSVMVAQTRAFRVLFVPIQVGDDTPPTCTTLARIQEEASSFLQAILPVAEDDFYSSFSCLTNWWVPAPVPGTPCIPAVPAREGSRLCNNELDDIVKGLDELADYAGVDKVIGITRPGWFHDFAPLDTAGAAGLSLNAGGMPWDGVLVDSSSMYAQVTAHEVLHTYGWVDANDPLYLANPAGHMGYYLSPGYWVAARMPKTVSVDLMFPNAVPDPWISTNTYSHLFQTFRLNPYDPPVIHIAGTIFKDGQATLDPWYRLDSTLDRDLGQPGAYTLAYLDGNGVEIAATGFDVQFENPYYDGEPVSLGSAPFSLRVPDVPGTARLELRQGDTVLAARDVSSNPPLVHVTSPNGGEIKVAGQALSVTWDSSDADGDALTHIVSLSRDGGQTWVPVAMNVAGNQATFTPTAADTTTGALVRVTTTDGINTAQDTSDATFAIRAGVGPVVTLGSTVNVSDTAIADPVGMSSFKAVAVADGQNVYASWSDAGSFDFRRSTDAGATFGTLTELGKTRDVSEAQGSRMAAAGGKVYVAWRGYLPPESYTQSHILFRRSTDGGATFEPAQALEPLGGTSSEDPQVAASGDNVYVLWFDWQTNNLILRVSHDAGATFGDPMIVGNAAPMPSYTNATSPRLAAIGSDLFIVWSSYVGGRTDVFFNRSADAGGAFAGSVKLSSNPGAGQGDLDPQLALADGRLYVAWREVVPGANPSSVNHLFIRSSVDDGASFSPALDLRPQLPASSPLDYGTLKSFRLAASGADVYLTWMSGPLVVSGGGDPDNGQELILLSASHDDGATFAPPVRVGAGAETLLTDPPQVAGSAGNVYVAWSQEFPIDSTGYFFAEERLRRSTDGGATFGEPIPLATSGPCDTYPSFRTLPLIPAADGASVLWKGRNCARTSFVDKDIFLRAVHESVATNQPPEVDAGADQTVAAGELVTLAGTATDPDGDPLLVSWSQTGGPPVALGTTDNLALNFVAPEVSAPATLTFELAANDGLANSVATVSVTVNPRPPITDFAEANPVLWDLMVGSSFPPTLSLDDTDSDGIINSYDNCPLAPNPDQTNTDTNNAALDRPGADGLGDACDEDDDGDGYTDTEEDGLAKDPLAYCAVMRADVTGDHVANLLDLAQVATWFGQAVPPAPERYRQNADNTINLLDLARQAEWFGKNVSLCP